MPSETCNLSWSRPTALSPFLIPATFRVDVTVSARSRAVVIHFSLGSWLRLRPVSHCGATSDSESESASSAGADRDRTESADSPAKDAAEAAISGKSELGARARRVHWQAADAGGGSRVPMGPRRARGRAFPRAAASPGGPVGPWRRPQCPSAQAMPEGTMTWTRRAPEGHWRGGRPNLKAPPPAEAAGAEQPQAEGRPAGTDPEGTEDELERSEARAQAAGGAANFET